MSCIPSTSTKYARKQEDEGALLSEFGTLSYIGIIQESATSSLSLYYFSKGDCQSEVVVKTFLLKSLSERELEHLKTEVKVLSSIDHENIIRIYGIVEIEFGSIGLVLEYLRNGSYSNFFGNFRRISGNNNYEDEIAPLKIRIIEEIASAMEYLHRPCKFSPLAEETSILHLNLNSSNVLLDRNLHAKICNFGLEMLPTLAKLGNGSTVSGGGVSETSGYIAPERLKEATLKPNTKCDVYSFGILQYEILTDLPPYPDLEESDLRLLACNEKDSRPDLTKMPSRFPTELLRLMEQCWSPLPDRRPSFSEISERMASIKKQIRDFERKASDSVNTVMAIVEYNERGAFEYVNLDDVESFSRSELAGDSFDETWHAFVDPETRTPQTGETAVKTVASISTGVSVEYGSITAQPIAQLNCYRPGNISAAGKVPIGKAIADCQGNNDQQPLLPPRKNGKQAIYETYLKNKPEKFSFSLAKFLMTLLAIGVVLAASITLILLYPRNKDDRPVCENPLHIINGKMKCSDQTFEGSFCSFSCQNHHILKGESSISCEANGTWSGPVPSCECPKCVMGHQCDNSIRWQDVDDNITKHLQVTKGVPIWYGGYMFLCSVTPHRQLNPTWIGKCESEHDETSATCSSDGLYKPVTAAKAAAAAFIHKLVTIKNYTKPCDSEKMPTDCN